MNRSPVVIAATVAGLALASWASGRTRPARQRRDAAALTTGNANVAGAQTVVGSDQQLPAASATSRSR